MRNAENKSGGEENPRGEGDSGLRKKKGKTDREGGEEPRGGLPKKNGHGGG